VPRRRTPPLRDRARDAGVPASPDPSGTPAPRGRCCLGEGSACPRTRPPTSCVTRMSRPDASVSRGSRSIGSVNGKAVLSLDAERSRSPGRSSGGAVLVPACPEVLGWMARNPPADPGGFPGPPVRLIERLARLLREVRVEMGKDAAELLLAGRPPVLPDLGALAASLRILPERSRSGGAPSRARLPSPSGCTPRPSAWRSVLRKAWTECLLVRMARIVPENCGPFLTIGAAFMSHRHPPGRARPSHLALSTPLRPVTCRHKHFTNARKPLLSGEK
jgi:hypothetical protein